MKITEAVQYVERNKLPRDPEWLRNRIFHLISLLWFHHNQLEKFQLRLLANNSTRPKTYTVVTRTTRFNTKITSKNPVFAPPLVDILNVLQDPKSVPKFPYRPKTMTISVPDDFPKLERVKYHADAYNHVQEDLERTVRSTARLMKS